MRKIRLLRSGLVFVVVMALTAIALSFAATPASAHRSGCHRWHSCPSEHASYRWHGLLCVAPYADERKLDVPQARCLSGPDLLLQALGSLRSCG
jgi:hypothetical protein